MISSIRFVQRFQWNSDFNQSINQSINLLGNKGHLQVAIYNIQ